MHVPGARHPLLMAAALPPLPSPPSPDENRSVTHAEAQGGGQAQGVARR